MRISDILRAMADLSDAKSTGSAENSAFKGRLEPVELAQTKQAAAAPRADKTASGNDEQPEDLYLPPLQMKMELLKKAVDVENIYDDGTPEEQEIERESADGNWTGPEHDYDYVGAPGAETAPSDEEAQEEYQDSSKLEEDEITRLKRNAGVKVNPAIIAELADDEPLGG